MILSALPSSPAEIKVIKVESDNVTLTIQPPQNNGGLTIERYWIRKKLDGQQWTRAYEPATVETVSKAITISVVNLTQENSYHFGACAENAMGKGDFLDTDSATVLPRKMGMFDPTDVKAILSQRLKQRLNASSSSNLRTGNLGMRSRE